MLPSMLTNAASLNPGINRWTMTILMGMDETVNLVDYQIHPSVIHSVAQLSYETAQELIDQKELTKCPQVLQLRVKAR